MKFSRRKFKTWSNLDTPEANFERCIKKIEDTIYSELSKYDETESIERVTVDSDCMEADEECEITIFIDISSDFNYEDNGSIDTDLLSDIVANAIDKCTKNSNFTFVEEDYEDDGDQIIFYYKVSSN